MDNNFTQSIVRMGREHGYTLGLARALDLLRQHGVEVDHPARDAVYKALMLEKPAHVDYFPLHRAKHYLGGMTDIPANIAQAARAWAALKPT